MNWASVVHINRSQFTKLKIIADRKRNETTAKTQAERKKDKKRYVTALMPFDRKLLSFFRCVSFWIEKIIFKHIKRKGTIRLLCTSLSYYVFSRAVNRFDILTSENLRQKKT